jgi:hypothetical protein
LVGKTALLQIARFVQVDRFFLRVRVRLQQAAVGKREAVVGIGL